MEGKCDKTGKTIFTTLTAARAKRLLFKRRFWDKDTGKRRNRNCKKPSQKREYLCDYCGGYHLTSLDHYKE